MKRKSIKKYSKEQQEVIINIQPGTKALIFEETIVNNKAPNWFIEFEKKNDKRWDQQQQFNETQKQFNKNQQEFNKRIEIKVNNLETKINKHHPE